MSDGFSKNLVSVRTQNHQTSNSSFVVDILSIGSNHRLDYLQAQRDSFASHVSVRHFFNVTEEDDDDPFCASRLSKRNVTMISRFCRGTKKWNRKRQFLMAYLRTAYATERWLRNKANPAGWMCAQTRPVQGFYKVIQYYKQQRQPLPDYLLIMDDDTYYNMQLFQEHFQVHYPNSSEPIAVAGCLVRSPIHQINFTIPFGGYGITLSRGYLQQMMRPIQCPRDHDWCHAIKRTNHLDERALFQNGMTLTDLLHTYATNQPFADFSNWTTGFCLHSDWIWGYITNFYNVSRHVQDSAFSTVPHARMHAYLGSELNAGDIHQGGRRLCDFQQGNCHSLARACHYSTPEEMKAITDIVRNSNPRQYRSNARTVVSSVTFENLPESNHLPPSSLVVDILSIGSTDRARYHQAQRQTMGSHDSVRFFFNVTEADDFDPLCRRSNKFPFSKAKKIINWCQSTKKWDPKRQWLMNELQQRYSPLEDVQEQHLSDWLCAQSRPIIGLHKVLQYYDTSTANNTTTLPDFLLMMADDTYYNMKIFPEMLRNVRYDKKDTQPLNPSHPLAVAGCLMMHMTKDGNVTFAAPTIGFGLILSRAVLENLRRPISCGEREKRIDALCDHIEEDYIGEKPLFVDGMAVIDLMYAYATHQPFAEYPNWTNGYCLRSDWSLGYFMNSYNISLNPGSLPKKHDNPSIKNIQAYLRSFWKKEAKGMCRNQGVSQCHSDTSYCHGIPPNAMFEYENALR